MASTIITGGGLTKNVWPALVKVIAAGRLIADGGVWTACAGPVLDGWVWTIGVGSESCIYIADVSPENFIYTAGLAPDYCMSYATGVGFVPVNGVGGSIDVVVDGGALPGEVGDAY